jgi:hypothetical protein
MNRIRPQLTYANVVATLALFIALGGSSYAALTITGKDVRNRSLTYKDLKRNTLGGTRIKESRLDTVPRARTATRLAGFAGGIKDNYTAADLLATCLDGTLPAANTCFEAAPRAAEPFSGAARVCGQLGAPFGFRRRLPDLSELKSLVGDGRFQIAAEGELTSTVSAAGPNQLAVLTMAPDGTTNTAPDTFEGRRPFRCVADPLG